MKFQKPTKGITVACIVFALVLIGTTVFALNTVFFSRDSAAQEVAFIIHVLVFMIFLLFIAATR